MRAVFYSFLILFLSTSSVAVFGRPAPYSIVKSGDADKSRLSLIINFMRAYRSKNEATMSRYLTFAAKAKLSKQAQLGQALTTACSRLSADSLENIDQETGSVLSTNDVIIFWQCKNTVGRTTEFYFDGALIADIVDYVAPPPIKVTR